MKNILLMIFLKFLFFSFVIFIQITNSLGSDEQEQINYKGQCIEDLNFIRNEMRENSAPFKSLEHKDFKDWFDQGYENAKELVDDIRNPSDCYYAIKFYLNGFDNSYISLRSYTNMELENYPGFLTAKYGPHHVIIYKHQGISYLSSVNVGDKITQINDMQVNDYFKEYILPFYANGHSEYSIRAASIYNFIVDGNPYVPLPLTATIIKNDDTQNKITLKYTKLSTEAILAAKNIRQPDPTRNFKIRMISDGVWINIPSFYLNTEEEVFYTGMLSKLKELAMKEDYILFDLRGNKGGAAKWSRPIIRNLWGDEYIKSLGKNHDYNSEWIKKIRVSKKNFIEFKKTATALEIKNFAKAIQKGDDYFEKKWKIYGEDLNLYTNKDSTSIKAKIFVFTDHFCRSTCFAFVSEMLQIPGVVHIGLPTAIQSSDSYARKARTPSEHFDFFYPTEIRVFPNRNAGKSLVPSKIFTGDLQDETAVINWVLSITEG